MMDSSVLSMVESEYPAGLYEAAASRFASKGASPATDCSFRRANAATCFWYVSGNMCPGRARSFAFSLDGSVFQILSQMRWLSSYLLTRPFFLGRSPSGIFVVVSVVVWSNSWNRSKGTFSGGISVSSSVASASLCESFTSLPEEVIVHIRNRCISTAAALLTIFPRTYSSQAFFQDALSKAASLSVCFSVFFW